MKKGFPVSVILSVLACVMISGCNQGNVMESVPATDEEQSNAQLSQNEEDTEDALSVNGAGENLSNQAENYGYSTKDRDSKNRPNSCLSYEEKYSSLGAHFIGEDEKVIYLTFDQGYENGYTTSILDTLKEKNVPAVFFVTGHYVETNADLIKRMIEEGHAIGNHSYSHPSKGLPSLDTQAQIDDIEKLADILKNDFGYECCLYRFPAGIFSEKCMSHLHEMGYTTHFWRLAYKDWLVDNQPDKTAALEKMVSQLHPGGIYLLHAVSSTNAQILGDFIDSARAEGYEFKLYTP